MFRSISQDANTSMTGDENGIANIPLGRRRTRSQSQRFEHERRELKKRTREAVEAMGAKRQVIPSTRHAVGSTPPPRTPPRSKKASPISIGASFGKDLPVEHTPPRGRDAAERRVTAAAMQQAPEKQAPAQPETEKSGASTINMASTARVRARASQLPARGIAQSSSSGGRKRMISFSPERADRPINEEAERQKRQRNLKANEKLQLRLDGGPLRTPEKPTLAMKSSHAAPTLAAKSPQMARTPSPSQQQKRSAPTLAKSPHATPTSVKPQLATPTQQQQSLSTRHKSTLAKSPQMTPTLAKSPHVTPTHQQQKRSVASPTTGSASQQNQVAVAPSPTPTLGNSQHFQRPCNETPDSGDSIRTMVLPSGDEEDEIEEEARAPSRLSSSTNANTVSCKKELDFTMAETTNDVEMKETNEEETKDLQQDEELQLSSQELQDGEADQGLSQPGQEDGDGEASVEVTNSAEHSTSIGFGSASEAFTSTSTIEDVGLFNCEIDVEYTGGVYGEGTDGKVSAATVRGQKVALKRAKPHDGFPEEEAKRRSAVELHYLRRVRHVPGFLQCLGLCDGIDHTCIALEVMDCKLSDYLRRYGRQKKSSSSSSKRRCFTLSQDATKAMLRQICQPMRELHDTVNVAHGDLACRNILLRLPPNGYEQKWEPVVKLSDFGRIKIPASEPPIFDDGFSFFKNCDVGAFAREILYRLLVGEIVPASCTETRTLHKHLQDVVVERIPERAKEKLGPFYRLFMRCAGWGVRPTFREMVEHLDDLEYFETSDNGYFPLKPTASLPTSQDTVSFLSPVGEDRVRSKATASAVPSSGSKNKYETPTTANPRGLPTTAPGSSTTTGVSRLIQPNKTLSEGPSNALKPINWLKARSVHPGGGQPGPLLVSKRPGSTVAAALATPSKQPVDSTPNGRPTKVAKKTPPSAGASRRSLQIINQFQHRLLHEKEKKKC
jgi:hypothetical protein